jgi:hypothetical protein
MSCMCRRAGTYQAAKKFREIDIFSWHPKAL